MILLLFGLGREIFMPGMPFCAILMAVLDRNEPEPSLTAILNCVLGERTADS